MASAQRIDIHHHIWPPRWLESPPDWLSGRSGDMAPTTNWDFVSKWTPSMTIDAMGKNDIATTVTSVASAVTSAVSTLSFRHVLLTQWSLSNDARAMAARTFHVLSLARAVLQRHTMFP